MIPTNEQTKLTTLSDAVDGSVIRLPEQHERAGIDPATEAVVFEQITHAILCLDGRIAHTLKETRKCRSCGTTPWNHDVAAHCTQCRKVIGPCCQRHFEGKTLCRRHYVLARILWLFQIR